MARRDHAVITGQPLIERPYWYENIENGDTFHDLYGCIAWPTEVSDKDNGLPGYAAVVGVVRPRNLGKDVHYDPADAKFMLLAEAEEADVPGLLLKCLDLREKYGFGLNPTLMATWLGDPERFVTTVALMNERLILKGGEQKTFLIAPPDDFYVSRIFDSYFRSLRSCMVVERTRWYFNGLDILQNRLKEFKRDDPAVLAAGGLVHSLLNRSMWMDRSEESTIFNVEEAA
jgi:hypothetical protein